MVRFECKPCVGVGRGFNFPIKVNILKDQEDIQFLRRYALREIEFPWFSVIIVDNF